MSEMKSALDSVSDSGESTAIKKSNSADPFQWSFAHGLVDAQLFLARLFFLRGSARDAEYFAQAAYDFSSSLYAPAMMARGSFYEDGVATMLATARHNGLHARPARWPRLPTRCRRS
jgi:hypothetical protein